MKVKDLLNCLKDGDIYEVVLTKNKTNFYSSPYKIYYEKHSRYNNKNNVPENIGNSTVQSFEVIEGGLEGDGFFINPSILILI